MTNTTIPDASTTELRSAEWRPQVFISFRGADLRLNFISYLIPALQKNNINYYYDEDELRGKRLGILFNRIRESQIALVFFSIQYPESDWCLDELVEIMKNMDKDKLVVIPIFFKVKPDDVKWQKKEFGLALYGEGRRRRPRMSQWEDALEAIPTSMGLVYEGLRFCFDPAVTQIFGIVGMAGIGKTKLAQNHFNKWKKQLAVNKILLNIHEKSNNEEGSDWLIKEDAEIFRSKSIILLDDVSEKAQIQSLLNNLHRIEKGSKIVITTRDKSWIKEVVHDTYVVPGLNEKEALQLFHYHAFHNQDYTPNQNITKLSRKFVDYAGGNPLALEELGKELCGKNETEWEKIIDTLPNYCNENIKRELKISYDKLTKQQKEVFLDIACFFRSEGEDCVNSLLDPKDSHESGEAARVIEDLAHKFMISVSAGHIEMPDIQCSLGKQLGLFASLKDNLGESRLWDHDAVVKALVDKEEKTDITVRGILLDVSKLKEEIAIAKNKLTLMPNLRYLKIFDSTCPQQCKVVDAVDCKVHLPDELELRINNIRYLHWLKFPLKKLPGDFNPENLVDLRLPYSKIERVWNDVKDTPNLKWVDLSHSTELIDLSALGKAESLERLTLEGCISLVDFPKDVENMDRLAFLNLRGCTSLSSLPEMENLNCLKTLILSGCTSFEEFQVKSKNLEYLHLDGTDITELPQTIKELERLIVLNLKGCQMLKTLPDCIHKLKALEELILSGCSKLRSFPEIKENMDNLQILLLDGTEIGNKPKIQRSPCMSGLSLLRRLCLSRNKKIISLQSGISDLYHLKWIDLKCCTKLQSISMLPPNLQCLDAHNCTSLKTVASPLARPLATEQVASSFIFTNCEKLEHAAKNEITCYGHNKGRLLSKTLNRHNKGLRFEALVATCFPGSEVPVWFGHKASGAELEPELPQHWSENGLVGIALCTIVSFEDQKIRNNNLQVKCICDFNNVKTSSSYFNSPVGGLSETGDKQRTIKSTHVFIGFTNWLNIKKCQEEDGNRCVPTKASIKFQVTDDIGEVKNCEVLKCGFSLVYETGSWEASSRRDVEQGEVECLEKNMKSLKLESKFNGETSCSSTKS
ncbi:hypothetical protein CARUB_v10022539mg [Capsella rubella]|uniref:ADP-ribosyl cyclase/cyclic ADP-ribose hydrolase n=1 Tax=Capsella rubella TaxID=81985 RepID=R0HMQ0_9BRAS|nr:hypothetical protein CARUB_v10022539mg [Capsella rubella]